MWCVVSGAPRQTFVLISSPPSLITSYTGSAAVWLPLTYILLCTLCFVICHSIFTLYHPTLLCKFYASQLSVIQILILWLVNVLNEQLIKKASLIKYGEDDTKHLKWCIHMKLKKYTLSSTCSDCKPVPASHDWWTVRPLLTTEVCESSVASI